MRIEKTNVIWMLSVVAAAVAPFGIVPCPPAYACKTNRCLVNGGCVYSAVQGKAFPGVFIGPIAAGATLPAPVGLLVVCGDNCNGACGPQSVVAATTTAYLAPGLPPVIPCPPIFPLGVGTVTAPATMPMPTCSSAGDFTTYVVPIVVGPAPLPPGVYSFCAISTITFSDGTVVTAVGDQVLCIVEPAPNNPNLPRLDLTLDTTGFINDMPRCAPGDQVNLRYIATNNDPVESVTLNPTADSNQIARQPGGDTKCEGVFAISGDQGDDFPIMFDPPPGFCIQLSPDPGSYVQEPISGKQIVIPPGGSAVITVGIRSYSQCSNGSCNETLLTVEGSFSGGDDAFACVGTSLWVDTSIPFPGGRPPCQPCGFPLNDCNENGVYDALDIYVNQTSLDLNYNAIPDECENLLTWFSDQNEFEQAARALGKDPKGIEDYEASILLPNQVDGFDDALHFGVANLPDGFPYPSGTDGLPNLWTQSNNLGAQGFEPSPAGTNGLAAASTGFLGATSDVVLSNTFVNGLDLIFDSGDKTAVGGRVLDFLGPQTGVEIMVFDTANVLLGQMHVPANAAGSNFTGVISVHPIGRINLFSAGAEGMDDIQAWVLEGCPQCNPCDCDPCDMNCDGDINALDIEFFIDLLFNNAVPCCGERGVPFSAGDVNGDGSINAEDIEGFINCLFGP